MKESYLIVAAGVAGGDPYVLQRDNDDQEEDHEHDELAALGDQQHQAVWQQQNRAHEEHPRGKELVGG